MQFPVFLLAWWICDLGRVLSLVYCGYFSSALLRCIFVYYSLNNFFILLSCFACYLLSVSSFKESMPCLAWFYFLQLGSFHGCGRECYRSWWSYLWSSVQNSVGFCNLYFLSTLLLLRYRKYLVLCNYSLSGILLSLSFEDALNSHGISG